MISRQIIGNKCFIKTFLERRLLAVLYIPPFRIFQSFPGQPTATLCWVCHFALPAVRCCCHECKKREVEVCVSLCVWREEEQRRTTTVQHCNVEKQISKLGELPPPRQVFIIFVLQTLSLFKTRCIESAAVLISIFRYCLLVQNTWHCPKL